MMTTALSLVLALGWVTPQGTDGILFDHLDTGFQLTVPREWKMAKTKDSHRFTFTITGTDRTAVLEIYAAVFSGDITTWNAVQSNAAKQLKREVARQWQEEILTVPMLMTRIAWEEKNAIGKTSDSGLIYADTRRKFLWKVTSNTDDIELANTQVRNVLQTIRTADGKLPKVFDPTIPVSEDLRRPDRPDRRTVWKPPASNIKDPVKGEKTFDATAGNIPVVVRYNGDWTFAADGNGFTATHPGVSGKVSLRAYNALESDPPRKALLKQAGQTLARFDKVGKREEFGPDRSTSGGQIMTIWREGTTPDGILFAFEAASATADYYVLLGWSTSDAKTAVAQRDLIAKLAQSLSVEPK